jgi:hypothetical protein
MTGRTLLPLAGRPLRRRPGGRAIEERGLGKFRQVGGWWYRPRHAVTMGPLSGRGLPPDFPGTDTTAI